MSKDLYVIAEQRDGEIAKVTLELLGEATILAADLGEKVYAVLMGDQIKDKAQSLIEAGADGVIVIEDPMLKEYVTEPYAKALTAMIKKYDPNIVLFGATSIGRDIAPRVAARVHTGLTADCTHLDINMNKYFEFLKATSTADTDSIEKKLGMDDVTLKMTRPAFGGNVMATIRCADYRPQMATVRPELYMACGISGAIQHIAGMENSECVIAINKNDTAAIFDVSDLGIVGDVKVIIPKLIDALTKYKAAQ